MRSAGAFLLAGVLLGGAARAEEAEGLLELRYQNREIGEVVAEIGRATGVSFVFDESLRGPITITGTGPVARAEALAILDAALLYHGFAAFPSPGGARRILHLSAAGSEAPWRPGAAGEGEAPVTTLVRLRSAGLDEVQAALRALAGTSTFVVPYPPSHSLILAGSELRLRRLLRVVQALDRDASESVAVRRLRYRSAEEVAELMAAAFAEEPPGAPAVRIAADARSNALLLRAPSAQLSELRRFAQLLDRPPEGGGEISVLPLLHADPEELAARLSALAAAPPGEADDAPAGDPLRGRDFAVTPDPPSHALLVRADPDTLRVLRDVIEQLDRELPQVMVEVLVFEVSTDASLRLGVDGFVPFANPRQPDQGIGTFSSNPSGGGFRSTTDAETGFLGRYSHDPVLVPIVGPDGVPRAVLIPRETVVVTANQRDARARVLMRPQLLMTSGQEQQLFAGDNVPVPTSQATGDVAAGPLEIRQNIERQDVGLRLALRPTVRESGAVHLELDLEVSTLGPSTAGSVAAVGPVFRERHLTTALELRDGEIALVGSAEDVAQEQSVAGAPMLTRIPVLGNLFRAKHDQQRRLRLLVTLQARVLRSRAELAAESIRRRLSFERAQAELEPLAGQSRAPYALLVTTRSRRDDAEAIASDLGLAGQAAQVLAWEAGGDARFDVYATGFESLSEAGTAALRLRARGWQPELRVVPEAPSRPT